MNIDNLHKDWLTLAKNYFDSTAFIISVWNNMKKNYSSKKRYYHNFIHIHTLLEMAEENGDELKDKDEVLFAIWFHDIVYNPSSKKNEEKSADLAKSILKENFKKELNINKIYDLIISTKKHQIILDEDNDNAFLLDFDLSILGSNWNVYESYIKNIRKEYKIYPDFVYNPARKKVLQHFLNRKQLYFTDKYQDLLEVKARQNLAREIKLLSLK
ncbi:hypothetical protein [Polaribacter sp. Asnod6-C07]|uniref:HD domain-containing protein n=1 Tax=Polaribacter sp. Asnod6-C07 TaxID=3160582 RepID=UPI00386CC0D4